MLRVFPAWLLCSSIGLASPGWAASPKAVLIGPSSVDVGQEIILHFTGSITDSDIKLKLEKGPDPIPITVLYTKDGKPALALARATKEGAYQFTLLTMGVPDGSKDVDYDAATLTVNVVDPGEPPTPPVPPNPNPNPGPTPNPNPTPTPAPVPPPSSNIDPAIRKASADYFSAYVNRYLAGRSKIAATDVTYNDLMASDLADRNTLGTALGKAIDAQTFPLLDAKTNFTSKPQAQAVWGGIAASVAAGLTDAARAANAGLQAR